MIAKHSIESTIILYLTTNWPSVTFLDIYYDCCCVGIVANLAVFYGQVSFPKPLTSQMVLDKEVYHHLSYLLCTSMTLPINCKWLMLVVMLYLLFADDAVIFAPSAKGLQQLLDICANFAISHNIVFNTVKSQCLIVTSKWAPMNPPAFYLNSTLLPITDSYKYLRHIINSCLTDDLDIQKQTISHKYFTLLTRHN